MPILQQINNQRILEFQLNTRHVSFINNIKAGSNMACAKTHSEIFSGICKSLITPLF
jgi:hypothetical protein